MAQDLRLYFFECGSLKTYTQFIKMNEGMGEAYEIPVPFFLITHPRGNVIFDGGNALEAARDAHGYWGEVAEIYEPVMTEDDFVVNQLRAMDIDPGSVRYVVQRRELEYAYAPHWFQAPGYVRADFDQGVDWLFLYGEQDDNYDLFGDGTIRTLFTPGHSPGHTSLVVTLEETGSMMLTADACYTMDHYKNEALPGLLHSAADCADSVQKIQRAVDALEATVVTGHDPDEWPKFKKAPEYYS